jgi:hypothetical protein
MKKTAALVAFLVIFLFGCGSDVSNAEIRSSAYRDKYDCYDVNIRIIMESMKLDAQEADDAFGVLAGAGINEEISNIIQMSNGLGQTYYRIWWGADYSTSVEVYVSDGVVVKISSGEDVLYDAEGERDAEKNDETQQVNGNSEDSTEPGPQSSDSSLVSDAPMESGEIHVQSLTSPVKRGHTAHMEILGTPGEEYSIAVHYASSISKAADLVPKTADENGLVTWQWKVGSRTAAGTYKIIVAGGGDTLETVFVVTE